MSTPSTSAPSFAAGSAVVPSPDPRSKILSPLLMPSVPTSASPLSRMVAAMRVKSPFSHSALFAFTSFSRYGCSNMQAMRHGYADERQKADQLNEEEGEPHRHDCIGLHMGHVDQGLTHAGNQDDRAQVVDCRAGDADSRNHQHDGRKYWETLDAVRVGSYPSLVPVLALEPIAPERCNRRSPEQDSYPAICAHGRDQQKHRPGGESQQHPHRYRHECISLFGH